MLSTTETARVGIVTARPVQHADGTFGHSFTHHADPRCSRIDRIEATVEVGVTCAGAVRSAMECDYCHDAAAEIARHAAEVDEPRRRSGDGTGRPVRSTTRTNRYAGKCANCGGWVEAEAGELLGGPGHWGVSHNPGDCVERTPEPAKLNSGQFPNAAEFDAAVAAAAPAASEPTPEGMHRLDDGRIFKVQIAHHGSGNPYAKLLVIHGHGDAEFVYAPGAIRALSTATLMTLDEAREYGALYGVCVKCGATLTDEDSIRFGIGPVCGQRVAEWSTGTKLTGAQVKMLMSLPVPCVARTAKTSNALVALGLARIVDGDVVAV